MRSAAAKLIGLLFFLLRAGAGVGGAKIYVRRLVDICFPAVQHEMRNLVCNGEALAVLVMLYIDADHGGLLIPNQHP